MKTLVAAAILFASAGAAWTQDAIPCSDPSGLDATGSCSTAPSTEFDLNEAGTLDQGLTSAIPQPPAPNGDPLVVPNDPLGNSVGNNPITGGTPLRVPQTNSSGNSGISSPSTQ